MKNRSGEKIKLASIDELLGVVNEESAMEIEISKIHPFKNHPFKVLDDEKMQDLVESVKINGVLTPVLLRMDENEDYEMVSGHRRMHAAQLAGLTTIPAIVRELSDDDAIVAMVDANIQREELLPSEKAFAYKMKLDAMKRQGIRTDLTCVQNEHKSGKKSRELLGEQVGISSVQVTRYIRLTELIPELLDLVDNKKLDVLDNAEKKNDTQRSAVRKYLQYVQMLDNDNEDIFNHELFGMHIKEKNDALSEENPHVCIGWSNLGDLSDIDSKEQLSELYEANYDKNNRGRGQDVGQIWRFIHDMKVGDYVIFAENSVFHIGRIESDYCYDTTERESQDSDYKSSSS